MRRNCCVVFVNIKYILYGLICLCPLLALSQYKSEFRAVWIATVDNIDWPNRNVYNAEAQKTALINLLDLHQRNGMNALIVQIRPAADAFYPSPYEPWSQWLTGKQGVPPSPYYDPLEFMITETHKRNMEFHAWINPYRAVFNIRSSSIAPTHITRLHPDWFLTYGDKRYFDPGNKQVQQYVANIVKDIVTRYSVDAIHFDDYFYPYKIPGKEFPDYAGFVKNGKGMSKSEWRRSNVDSLIFFVSQTIKKLKPQCKFGISPFGVWRNADKDADGSRTKAGITNYDDLYADVLLWLKKGWIDYVAPQLYWEIGHKLAPYEELVNWWSRHTYGRHCYIGLGIYRANSNNAWKNKAQIPSQIKALRNTPNIQGMVFYSSNTFEKNPNGWNDSLRNNYYRTPVLIPPMPWLDTTRPAMPQINTVALQAKDSTFLVEGELTSIAPVKRLVVYTFTDEKPGQKAEIEKVFYFTPDRKKFSLQFPYNPRYKSKSFGITVVSGAYVESNMQSFRWVQ